MEYNSYIVRFDEPDMNNNLYQKGSFDFSKLKENIKENKNMEIIDIYETEVGVMCKFNIKNDTGLIDGENKT